jgi:hypothetical protein
MRKVYVNTFDEAKHEFLNFIGMTKSKLLIMAGELYSKVYGEPDVLDALRSAIDRNVSIEIASGPEIDVNSVEVMKLARDRLIELYRLPNREHYHFRVSDTRNVFLETAHPPFKEDRRGSVFIYDTVTLGVEYEELFYRRIREQNAPLINGERVLFSHALVRPEATTVWPGKKIELAVPATEEQKRKYVEVLS